MGALLSETNNHHRASQLLAKYDCNLDKYVCSFGQIHFAIRTNTFHNLDKYWVPCYWIPIPTTSPHNCLQNDVGDDFLFMRSITTMIS